MCFVVCSLPYCEFFGGVSGLTVEQFHKINGFPNAFWGWGGEDDDLWNRLVYLRGVDSGFREYSDPFM